MSSFNRVIIMGNLTRDPAMKYTPSQMAICEFGLACNRKFKTAGGEAREEVTFVDVTAFGKQAEVINQYMTKGKPVLIEGRLKFDSWDDKNGGGKRSKLSIVVENFQFVGGKSEGDDGDQRQEYPRSRETLGGKRPTGPEVLSQTGAPAEEDIPF